MRKRKRQQLILRHFVKNYRNIKANPEEISAGSESSIFSALIKKS
jgi:hypothetical protein